MPSIDGDLNITELVQRALPQNDHANSGIIWWNVPPVYQELTNHQRQIPLHPGYAESGDASKFLVFSPVTTPVALQLQSRGSVRTPHGTFNTEKRLSFHRFYLVARCLEFLLERLGYC